MSDSDANTCVVFGAGALGLGFLGPELSHRMKLVFVDVERNAELLSLLARKGYYFFNETGPAACVRRIENVSGLLAGEERKLCALLSRTDLVLTAVGGENLKSVAPWVSRALRTRKEPMRILCCENGIDMASKLRGHVVDLLGEEPGDALITGDTVMGRMCKTISPAGDGLEPLFPGFDVAAAGEPFYGIPVPSNALDGLEPLPDAFQSMSPPRFAAQEDIKMLAHNALHAFLAFMAAAGPNDAAFFSDLSCDDVLMETVYRMLHDEAAPALLIKHRGVIDRNELLNFLPNILRRITCKRLHDPLQRGRRGVMRKLRPEERLVGSVRTIYATGVRPTLYAMGLAAAAGFAVKSGASELSFEQIIDKHCGFENDEDRPLVEAIMEGAMKTGVR